MLLLDPQKCFRKDLADVSPASDPPANVSTVSRDFPETGFFHQESSICGSQTLQTLPLRFVV